MKWKRICKLLHLPAWELLWADGRGWGVGALLAPQGIRQIPDLVPVPTWLRASWAPVPAPALPLALQESCYQGWVVVVVSLVFPWRKCWFCRRVISFGMPLWWKCSLPPGSHLIPRISCARLQKGECEEEERKEAPASPQACSAAIREHAFLRCGTGKRPEKMLFPNSSWCRSWCSSLEVRLRFRALDLLLCDAHYLCMSFTSPGFHSGAGSGLWAAQERNRGQKEASLVHLVRGERLWYREESSCSPPKRSGACFVPFTSQNQTVKGAGFHRPVSD